MQVNKDGTVRKDQVDTAKELENNGDLKYKKETNEDGKKVIDERCKFSKDLKKYKEYENNPA
jgi:hypothetical protein